MTNEEAIKQFAEKLVERVEHHRDYVYAGNGSATDNAYRLAHDHIVDVIKQEADAYALMALSDKMGG